MGKIRTRTIGLEAVEKEQKSKQKLKLKDKKVERLSDSMVDVSTTVVQVEPGKKKTQKSNISARRRVRGKKHKKALSQVKKDKAYSINDAISLLKSILYAHFDESVEIHMNILQVGLRGEVELPHTTGKTLRISILNDDILSKIESGKIEFDVLITHPSYMPKLARFAKVLGPRGLMPNPKAGTISNKPEEVVKKFQKGLLRWKSEAKFPIIHQVIGKVSQDNAVLEENIGMFLSSVGQKNIKDVYIKTSMSPGVKIVFESI